LVEKENPNGITRVLIDSGPDMRAQLVEAGVGTLDAVVYTHSHADHVHGLDDLRQVVFNTRKRLQVWADGATQDALLSRFGYAFVQPADSPYPPILEMNTISGDVTINGAGGEITLTPIDVNHGSIDALGFRVNDVAYMPDVAEIYDASWGRLEGLECWIVDALRRTPHPTHAHLEKSLEWIARVQPKTAILTNMHIDLDYDELNQETPDHIHPAFDGLVLTYQVPA
jgi:phosphoribosyl 1,2-cyclic phosphate phosphodiesterase